ncbi:MAG: TlpA family protein disulfide reductase [Bacillota bacterium]
MKKSIIIWVIAVILAGTAVFLLLTNNKPADSGIKDNVDAGSDSAATDTAGIAVPEIKLYDLDGQEWTLSKLKGKKVFLNFWTTWCGYCKLEMPDMEKVYQETKDSDLVMLAVNVGESKELAESFMKNNGYSFTVLLDSKGSTANDYGVTGLPTSIFINSDGTFSAGQAGALKYEQMMEYINKLK